MKPKTLGFLFLVAASASLLMLFSCEKEYGCYDEDLANQHKYDICTADCPGVEGCDGNYYCNECEANKKGITVVR